MGALLIVLLFHRIELVNWIRVPSAVQRMKMVKDVRVLVFDETDAGGVNSRLILSLRIHIHFRFHVHSIGAREVIENMKPMKEKVEQTLFGI